MYRRIGISIMLIFLFCLADVSAQQKMFVGYVIDAESGEPLIGALLTTNEKPIMYGHTDVEGKFLIPSSLDQATFTISYLGFESKVETLKVDEESTIRLFTSQFVLDELVIISDKTTERGVKSLAQVSLDKEILSRNSSAGLGQVLSEIDGVTFISTGTNIQLPVIHGLYGNRILILNNGFKHGFQNWGSDHAPEIDVAGADIIKVVKGAAGVKYGPDALGGAIIIENNELALNKSLYGQATTSYQTNGRGYGINAMIGEGRENFSYHLGGNFNQVGDRKAPRYQLTNTGAIEYAFQGGMRYSYGNWSVKANFSAINQNLGILRAAIGSSGPALIRNMEADIPTFIRDFSYNINEPNQLVSHQMASATLSRYFDNGNVLSLRYARQWNARQEFDVRRNADLPILDLELITDDIQLEWEHSWSDKINGSYGLQYFSQSNSNNPGTRITPYIPNYATTRLSAFLLESLEIGRDAFELGIRYDFEQNAVSGRDNRQVIFRDNFTFSNFTAALGYIKPVNRYLTIRNNIGTGWRPPNMAELFSFGQHESQTMFGLLRYEPDEERTIQASRVIPLSESNVLPENSIKYTTELDWQKGNQRLSLTAYANYIRNFIFQRPIGVLGTARGPMPTFIVDQADALFLGSDLTYDMPYHTDGKATFGLSYIWSRNVQRSEPLINQPPVHVHMQLNHTFHNVGPIDKIVLNLHPSYTFTQFQAPRFISVRSLVEGTVDLTIDDPIFDFQEPPPGYFLLNGFVQLQKDNFTFNIEAHNLLNVSYRDYLNNMRYFADEIGINLIFSLTYKF